MIAHGQRAGIGYALALMAEVQTPGSTISVLTLAAFDISASIQIAQDSRQRRCGRVQLIAKFGDGLSRLKTNRYQYPRRQFWQVEISRDFSSDRHQGTLSCEQQRNSVIQFLITKKQSRIEAGRICPYVVDIHHGDLRMPVN